ncbi:MAG: hypothetical protein M3M96_07180, partial [Candidatus Eremiobacteraeota bacterium]|nr:hypothetical protein [Candidatus Eremiobacteraeota bacterium]
CGAWRTCEPMETATGINWPRILAQAFLAGATGAVLLHVYLWLTVLLPHHTSIVGLWQWIASVAIGKVALTNAGYAWLGVAVHLGVSIAWAGGYAFLAAQRHFMNDRWIVSGLVYGIVVYVFMQLLLLGANSFSFPATPNDVINALFASAAFFGLPVAYVVTAMNRTRA